MTATAPAEEWPNASNSEENSSPELRKFSWGGGATSQAQLVSETEEADNQGEGESSIMPESSLSAGARDKSSADDSMAARSDESEEDNATCHFAETGKAAKSARRSVSSQTPCRRSSIFETDAIRRLFPEPVEDDDYQDACKVLRDSFENVTMDQVSCNVIQCFIDTHLPYLEAIHDKSVPSEMRLEYEVAVMENRGHKLYADGGILLSFNNMNYVLTLIGKHFFKTGAQQNKYMSYTMNVLMPEFLARVVMSVYKLTKEEAIKKIKEMSIQLSGIIFAD